MPPKEKKLNQSIILQQSMAKIGLPLSVQDPESFLATFTDREISAYMTWEGLNILHWLCSLDFKFDNSVNHFIGFAPQRLHPILERQKNSIGKDGYSPVIRAATQGHLGLVKLLHGFGVDLAATSPFSNQYFNAFSAACYEGHRSIVEYLCNKLDIAAQNNRGFTALMAAVKSQQKSIIVYLLLQLEKLENREHINQCSKTGCTALHLLAVQPQPNLSILKLLIRNGAKPSDKDPHHGVTPFTLFVQKNHLECVKYLLSIGAVDINQKSRSNDGTKVSPYDTALGFKYHEMQQLLLAAGAELGDNPYDTPLHKAVENNDEVLVKQELKSSSCALNLKRHDGVTPLHLAVRSNNLNISRLLLNAKALPNISDHKNGVTALHMAIIEGNSELTKLLIESKANVNASLWNGQTVLFHATCLGIFSETASPEREALIDLLLQAKANPNPIPIATNYQTSLLQTPLMIAIRINHCGVITKLLEASRGINQVNFNLLYVAIKENLIDSIKIFCQQPLSLSTLEIDGYTPLQKAVALGRAQIVTVFIEAKVNLNHATKKHCAPLLIALCAGDNNIAQSLVKAGAVINILIQGYSALSIAIALCNMTTLECILDRPAIDIDAASEDVGFTALHMAIILRNSVAVQLLLSKQAKLVTPYYGLTEKPFSAITDLLLITKKDIHKVIPKPLAGNFNDDPSNITKIVELLFDYGCRELDLVISSGHILYVKHNLPRPKFAAVPKLASSSRKITVLLAEEKSKDPITRLPNSKLFLSEWRQSKTGAEASLESFCDKEDTTRENFTSFLGYEAIYSSSNEFSTSRIIPVFLLDRNSLRIFSCVHQILRCELEKKSSGFLHKAEEVLSKGKFVGYQGQQGFKLIGEITHPISKETCKVYELKPLGKEQGRLFGALETLAVGRMFIEFSVGSISHPNEKSIAFYLKKVTEQITLRQRSVSESKSRNCTPRPSKSKQYHSQSLHLAPEAPDTTENIPVTCKPLSPITLLGEFSSVLPKLTPRNPDQPSTTYSLPNFKNTPLNSVDKS